MHDTTELLPRAHNDIVGLDAVFEGGWARNRLHLLEASPGTGKTTIALQFLIAGARDGEAGMDVSLAETEQGCGKAPADRDFRAGATRGQIVEHDHGRLVPGEIVLQRQNLPSI
jgi:circadian clock protein KaiC